MQTVKAKLRKFVAADPAKCTGCSLCEYVCALEKQEYFWTPLRSRIRVVRLTPALNIALTCRFCENAPCVVACPRKALTQSDENGVIFVDESKCNNCGWCVQACPYGGVAIHPDKHSVLICDVCGGEPRCVEFCPEEALELVFEEDDAANMLINAFKNITVEIEKLANLVKKRELGTLLAEAEEKAKRLSKKLEQMNSKWGLKLNPILN